MVVQERKISPNREGAEVDQAKMDKIGKIKFKPRRREVRVRCNEVCEDGVQEPSGRRSARRIESRGKGCEKSGGHYRADWCRTVPPSTTPHYLE